MRRNDQASVGLGCKCVDAILYLRAVTYRKSDQFHSSRRRGSLGCMHESDIWRRVRIEDERDPAQVGRYLFQNFQPLAAD